MDATLVLDATRVTLTEFKFFHGIDRLVYIFLVNTLSRNPCECMQIMGFWLWLERYGYCKMISMVLRLSPLVINELADEAVTCLKFINSFMPGVGGATIPFTCALVTKELSLQYFRENRLRVLHEVHKLVSDICIPVLSDLMETARHDGFNEGPARRVQEPIGPPTARPSANDSLVPVLPLAGLGDYILAPTNSPDRCGLARPTPSARPPVNDSLDQRSSGLVINGDASSPPRARATEASRLSRTMFATFSKGYSVTEAEVRGFFTRVFGDYCIESLHMQEVGPDVQALYARIVFSRASLIPLVLAGATKAKFNINGKHVWMRQFVPRGGKGSVLACGCPSVGPSTCPHLP